jgi:tetratricopeptide (TPR) repeat protein
VRKGAVSAAAVVANECSELDDQAAAVLAWKVAIQEAERGEVAEVLTLRLALGNQLMEAEEYSLAEDVLTRLRRQLAVEGTEADRARCLMSLGHAYRHLDRHDEALAAWAEATRFFREGGEPGEAARALLATGTLHSREGRDQEAITAYYAAVSTARQATEDLSALPQALHALGHALCEAGDPEGVTHLDEAIRLAHDYGAHWHEADYSDTRARGLWALDHGPAAVSAALAAADLYAAAADAASAGNAELFAAYVLVELDRPSDAVAMFKMVLGQPEIGTTLRVAANLGLAGALDTLGLADEARQAREAAEKEAENGTD